jgi:hypothetical protein
MDHGVNNFLVQDSRQENYLFDKIISGCGLWVIIIRPIFFEVRN